MASLDPECGASSSSSVLLDVRLRIFTSRICHSGPLSATGLGYVYPNLEVPGMRHQEAPHLAVQRTIVGARAGMRGVDMNGK